MPYTAKEKVDASSELEERLQYLERVNAVTILASEKLAERVFHMTVALDGALRIIFGEHDPDVEGAEAVVTTQLTDRIASLENEVAGLKDGEHGQSF